MLYQCIWPPLCAQAKLNCSKYRAAYQEFMDILKFKETGMMGLQP